MHDNKSFLSVILVTLMAAIAPGLSLAAQSKPNIVFIMGDDIGMWNISAYHRGLMAGRTPNLWRTAGASRKPAWPSSMMTSAM